MDALGVDTGATMDALLWEDDASEWQRQYESIPEEVESKESLCGVFLFFKVAEGHYHPGKLVYVFQTKEGGYVYHSEDWEQEEVEFETSRSDTEEGEESPSEEFFSH